MLIRDDDNAIVYLLLLCCFLCGIQMDQSSPKYVETSCKMCLTTDDEPGANCAVKTPLENRNYNDNCISTSDYRFCYVVKPKDRNQTNYGCTWPEADTRKYRDMNSCNKTTFMSDFRTAGEDDINKTCACTRNCSAAGMFSFRLEGYQVYHDPSPSLGKSDSDPNSALAKSEDKSSCNQECIAAIAVSGVFVGLALVGAILYFYRRHAAKDHRERSCQRCNITASSTASNCSLEMEFSARNHTENCRDGTNHQYCYLFRTENNTKSYGCSWPTPDAKQYDPDIGSCDKDVYRSRVQQSNDTQCACSRNCSVGMFSFLMDDAEVPYDNSNDGRGDYDSDYVCKSECFIGIVTTSSILLLAIVCYTIYLCTHRKSKAVLNNSVQPKTVANSNLHPQR